MATATSDTVRELHQMALRMCRSRWRASRCGISAEDIAQDVMLAAHRNAGSLTGMALERYVCGIVAHKLADAHRSAYSVERLEWPVDVIPDVTSTSSTADQVLTALHRDAIFAALHGVTQKQRIALVLRYWLGYRAAEVAEMMSISEAAVRVTARRGAEMFQRIIPLTLEEE